MTSGDWTTTAYDELDRVISTTAPSGAQTLVSFALNQKSVTEPDSSSVKRKFTTDTLDRLTSVAEEPNGANDITSYTYDGEGRLKTVTQGTQTRTFTYDLAGRLLSAQNPESGTINYAYDLNGNLIRRTDPQSTVTCYGIWNGTTCDGSGYDVLNRPTKKSYGTPAGVSATSTVVYCYDGQTYSSGSCTGSRVGIEHGLLTSVGNTQSSTDYQHDVAGRLVASTQKTVGLADKPFTYSHFAGDVGGAVVYPSNRHVVTCPNALQRVAWVSGSKTADQCAAGAAVSATEAYVSGTQYWPHGGLKQLTLGNSLVENTSYNVHLQPERLRLGSTASATTSCGATGDLWCIQLGYGTTTANNGNVRTQDIWSKKNSTQFLQLQQSYNYDLRNRLTTFAESVQAGGSSGGAWSETNSYDRWGNRSAVGTFVNVRTPGSLSNFDPATNRITSTAAGSVVYNSAGNLQSQDTSGPFTYDAENRLSAFGGTTTYGYDGEGRRVKKVDGGTTTYYVYDGSGNLMAEYGGSPAQSVGGTRYVTVDHLGTTRVTTDATGAVKMRCDYAPFGDQIGATEAQGNRHLITEYACSEAAPTQKFTGKERDAETGLDYFIARYYSSAQGRFTSPDEFPGGIVDPFTGQQVGQPGPLPYADITNPQSLNKYVYALNNPLRFIDPDGHEADEQKKQKAAELKRAAQEQARSAAAPKKLDKEKLVKYMDDNAKKTSQGRCAAACQAGLAAGGLDVRGRPGEAKAYGPFLEKLGASEVPAKNYTPQKADIAVFAGNDAHPHGHVQVYNGTGWVSDFKQRADRVSPYSDKTTPPVTFYRFPDAK